MTSTIFLDTVGLLALWDVSDQWHDVAAAGIVDHLSFAVMRRHHIREAFANDRHFEAASFTILF